MLKAIKVVGGICGFLSLSAIAVYTMEKPGWSCMAVGEGQTILTGESFDGFDSQQKCESHRGRVQKDPLYVKSTSCGKALFH